MRSRLSQKMIFPQDALRAHRESCATIIHEMETLHQNSVEPNKLKWRKVLSRITDKFEPSYALKALHILKNYSFEEAQSKCFHIVKNRSDSTDAEKFSFVKVLLDSFVDKGSRLNKDKYISSYMEKESFYRMMENELEKDIVAFTYYSALLSRFIGDRDKESQFRSLFDYRFTELYNKLILNRNEYPLEHRAQFIWSLGTLKQKGLLTDDFPIDLVKRSILPAELKVTGDSCVLHVAQIVIGLTKLNLQSSDLYSSAIEEFNRSNRLENQRSSAAVDTLWWLAKVREPMREFIEPLIIVCANRADFLSKVERQKLNSALKQLHVHIQSAAVRSIVEQNLIGRANRSQTRWNSDRQGLTLLKL